MELRVSFVYLTINAQVLILNLVFAFNNRHFEDNFILSLSLILITMTIFDVLNTLFLKHKSDSLLFYITYWIGSPVMFVISIISVLGLFIKTPVWCKVQNLGEVTPRCLSDRKGIITRICLKNCKPCFKKHFFKKQIQKYINS